MIFKEDLIKNQSARDVIGEAFLVSCMTLTFLLIVDKGNRQKCIIMAYMTNCLLNYFIEKVCHNDIRFLSYFSR